MHFTQTMRYAGEQSGQNISNSVANSIFDWLVADRPWRLEKLLHYLRFQLVEQCLGCTARAFRVQFFDFDFDGATFLKMLYCLLYLVADKDEVGRVVLMKLVVDRLPVNGHLGLERWSQSEKVKLIADSCCY